MTQKWYMQNNNNSDVVVSTRIRLARNIKEYPFPNRLDIQQKEEIAQKIIKALKESNSAIADSLNVIKMSSLRQVEAISLVERHIISPDFASDKEASYLLLTQDETISIMINEEDHIRIQVLSKGLDLENAYKTADKLDVLLDNALNYAFNSELGFLTQCPTNLGTGMRASVMLHLPALKQSNAINRISSNLSKLGLVLRGIYGEGTQSKGSMYQLSNQVTLGISEQTAIDNLKNITSQLITQENNARENQSKNIELLDIISRSRGILLSARLLSNDECMKVLSNVRLGISLGEIKDLSYSDVDELMTICQPATLMVSKGENLTSEQRDVIRANIVREKIRLI